MIVSGGTNDSRITVTPIVSIAGYRHVLGRAQSPPESGDFMNPVLPFWRLFHRGSKLRLDEPEPCRYAKHWSFGSLKRRSPGGPRQGFFRS